MSRRLIPVLLLALGWLAFSPGLDSPFYFDSKPALVRNQALAGDGVRLFDWIAAAESSTTGPLGRPVSMLSFAADGFIGAEITSSRIKIVNLIWHLATACLLFLCCHTVLNLLLGTTPSRLTAMQRGPIEHSFGTGGLAGTEAWWAALIAAGLWILHPLQVSTVLYGVQRMAQLSTFFSLIAVLIYLRFRLDSERNAEVMGSPSHWSNCLCWVGLFTALAAFSKENGLLLPWALILIEWMCFSGSRFLGRWRSLLPFAVLLPFLLLACTWLFTPAWLLTAYEARDFTMEERLLTQARVLWAYLFWWVVPDVRAMGLHHDDVVISTSLLGPASTVLSVIVWIGLTVFAVYIRRRSPVILFGLIWYLLWHSMESSIVPLEMVYEHRNYLPLAGPSMVLAWFIVRMFHLSSRRVLGTVAAFIFFSLAALTWMRASYWSDELAFTAFQLKHHPESVRTTYHYANARLREADIELDVERRRELIISSRAGYLRMLELDSNSIVAIAGLLWVDGKYFSGGESDLWVTLLEEAALLRHLDASDYNALNLLVDCVGAQLCYLDGDDLSLRLTELSARFPLDSYLLNVQSRHYRENLGELEMARQFAEKAIQLDPEQEQGYRELIATHIAAGNSGLALETIRKLHVVSKRAHGLQSIGFMFEPGRDT